VAKKCGSDEENIYRLEVNVWVVGTGEAGYVQVRWGTGEVGTGEVGYR